MAVRIIYPDRRKKDDRGRDGGTNFTLRIKEQDNKPNPS
jgi:hypothetical protein